MNISFSKHEQNRRCPSIQLGGCHSRCPVLVPFLSEPLNSWIIGPVDGVVFLVRPVGRDVGLLVLAVGVVHVAHAEHGDAEAQTHLARLQREIVNLYFYTNHLSFVTASVQSSRVQSALGKSSYHNNPNLILNVIICVRAECSMLSSLDSMTRHDVNIYQVKYNVKCVIGWVN